MKPKSFSIANFKSFGNKINELPLKPLTLVFGPNSAGKSSLLQSLMYLEDVLHSGEIDCVAPRLGKGKIDIGGFKQALHRRGDIRHMIMGFSFAPEIIPTPDRNWFDIKHSFSINLTLGPYPQSQEMGTQAISLEVDGRELLRASRREDGPMKINIFDFEHPAMSRLLATLGARKLQSDSNEAVDESDEWVESDFKDKLCKYLNLMVLQGGFEISIDEILPRVLRFKFKPDLADAPEEEEFQSLRMIADACEDHMDQFVEDTLPSAFRALFAAYSGYTKNFLSSLSHVPPLRELPPRVFDLNHYPDALWRRIANDPRLRQNINSWLGSKSMKTRYELQIREFAPLDEIQSRIPEALDKKVTEIFEKQNFVTEFDDLLNDLSAQFDSLDQMSYLKKHPTLYEQLVSREMQNLHDEAINAPLDDEQRDYLLLGPKEARQQAEFLLEDIASNDSSYYPEIWEHFKQKSPELQQFLSENWDTQKSALNFYQEILPKNVDTRKEISLVELPSRINVSLQDVGVGISQVLPVLMSAYGEKNSIVAIEQPEIHIHPRLQSDLADVFIESALGENQNSFLLETHSEHLILRLLRRIRETSRNQMNDWPEELKAACPNGIRPDDVSVLYIEPGEEGAQIRHLRINDQGRFIDEWPNGFFEDRLEELI